MVISWGKNSRSIFKYIKTYFYNDIYSFVIFEKKKEFCNGKSNTGCNISLYRMQVNNLHHLYNSFFVVMFLGNLYQTLL